MGNVPEQFYIHSSTRQWFFLRVYHDSFQLQHGIAASSFSERRNSNRTPCIANSSVMNPQCAKIMVMFSFK